MIIDLFADVACPWCWIGERRLKRVLDERGITATVRWRPYQLQRGLPPEGLPWNDFVESKFGGWARARPMFAQVAAAGAGEGLRYDFEAVTRAPNTRNAHRVLLLAQEYGKLWEAAEAIYSAYFAEGRDVTDTEVLSSAAGAAGLDAEEVRAMLAGDMYADEVEAAQGLAERSGITGVPFVVFDERFAVSGAQPPEVFHSAIDHALGDTAEAA
ncbi:MAG TPA: DsbA family oxidoreductase [Longimicrobium sp.]|nr:DsbA family oxidoreductase [Longimicrobium sp.]